MKRSDKQSILKKHGNFFQNCPTKDKKDIAKETKGWISDFSRSILMMAGKSYNAGYARNDTHKHVIYFKI